MHGPAEFSPLIATLASTPPSLRYPQLSATPATTLAWTGAIIFNEGYRTEEIPDIY